MKEDCIKFICDKAGVNYYVCIPDNHTCPTKEGSIECIKSKCNGLDTKTITLEILIKAMWKINREWIKTKDRYKYKIYESPYSYDVWYDGAIVYSESLIDNNSEQEALEKALQYIFDNKDKI